MAMRWDSAPANMDIVISALPKADLVRTSSRISRGSSDVRRMWRARRNAKSVVVRFRFDDQRVRMAHNSDPVTNADGKTIGYVTSCAIDSEDS